MNEGPSGRVASEVRLAGSGAAPTGYLAYATSDGVELVALAIGSADPVGAVRLADGVFVGLGLAVSTDRAVALIGGLVDGKLELFLWRDGRGRAVELRAPSSVVADAHAPIAISAAPNGFIVAYQRDAAGGVEALRVDRDGTASSPFTVASAGTHPQAAFVPTPLGADFPNGIVAVSSVTSSTELTLHLLGCR